MRSRGSVLVEVTMAATLVAIAMMAVAQLLAVSGRQERQVERRRLAGQEAANALERVLAQPWESVTPKWLEQLSLSPESRPRLPDGQLQCHLEQASGPPAVKRVVAIVSWPGQNGGRERVQLAVWRFQPPEKQP